MIHSHSLTRLVDSEDMSAPGEHNLETDQVEDTAKRFRMNRGNNLCSEIQTKPRHCGKGDALEDPAWHEPAFSLSYFHVPDRFFIFLVTKFHDIQSQISLQNALFHLQN